MQRKIIKPISFFQHETADAFEGSAKAAFGVLKVADLQAHNIAEATCCELVDRLFSEFSTSYGEAQSSHFTLLTRRTDSHGIINNV